MMQEVMMELVTIKSLFPDPTRGIFTEFYLRFEDLPWDEDCSTYLDFEYLGNQSGSKFASPMLLNMRGNEGTISGTMKTALANILHNKFIFKWTKLWETFTAEYNPIHNYDMTEITTRQLGVIGSQTRNGTLNRTGSDTTTHNTEDKTEHGMSVTSDSYHYGFNSDSASPSDKDVSTESGDTTIKHTGTDSLATQTGEMTSDSTSDNKNETETTTINRSGNIGVTTSQQMIQAERDLWKWNFFEQVFRDLDSVLTIDVYDPCQI